MKSEDIIAEELQKLNRNIDILEPVIFSIEELLKEIVNKNNKQGETREHE